MTKLSDLHYVLLAIAARRASGSILPPSTSIGATRAGLTRAINTLIKNGLAEEIESEEDTNVWRVDGDRKLAAIITDAGRAAVVEADGKKGLEAAPSPCDSEAPLQPSETDPISPASEYAKPRTKQSLVLAMLTSAGGAALSELVEATGWLPHTTRAALTGLRKKGNVITASRMDGVTVYRIQPAA